MPESPYITAAEAAAYMRKTAKAFDHFCVRHGLVPDAKAGRIRLYLSTSIEAVLQAMAARPTRRARVSRRNDG